MSEQQPNQTKQMSGSKLFAIIVAAILTCAAVIGALFAINAYDEQKRRNKAVLGQVRYETLKFRKQMMHTEGGFFDPGSQEWKLYIEWVGSADKGTTEEQIARLDELERKLKVMKETPAPAPPPPAPIITLTEPVSVQTATGTVTLPVGTKLEFVSQINTKVRVHYLNSEYVVPVSATRMIVASLYIFPLTVLKSSASAGGHK